MTCRICGSSANSRNLVLYEKMYGTGEAFPYFECGGCGCLQIERVPPDLGKYYPSGYYSYSAPLPLRGPLRRWTRRIKYDYVIFDRGWLGKLLYEFRPEPYGQFRFYSRLPVTRETRILDVGCGSGRDLHKLREHGFAKVHGVDPYLPETIRYENGLTVLKKDFLETEGEWDVIVFNHVLEHLPDPHAIVRHARRVLAAGGACIVRVPVIPCHAFERYGTNWVQLDAPRHLFTYSVEAIRTLAERNGLRFEEDRYYYDSLADQFWGSELYSRGLRLLPENADPRRNFSRSELAVFKRQARELNTLKKGDQAVFYLTKG